MRQCCIANVNSIELFVRKCRQLFQPPCYPRLSILAPAGCAERVLDEALSKGPTGLSSMTVKGASVMPSAYSAVDSVQSRVASCVYAAVGALLLVAGTLKAVYLARDQSVEDLLFTNRELAAAGVGAELALGLWLLTGLFPTASRASAVVAFTIFFAASLGRGLAGESSCGCFGGLTVPPWATGMMDLTVVGLMLAFRPPVPPTPVRRHQVSIAGAGLLIITVPIIWLIAQDRSLDQVTVTPIRVELGSVPCGGMAETTVTVANRSSHNIKIVDFRVSCLCATVSADPRSIEPGEQMPITILLDMARQPDFTGRRSVTVTGMSAAGQPVFRLTVSADVEGIDGRR